MRTSKTWPRIKFWFALGSYFVLLGVGFFGDFNGWALLEYLAVAIPYSFWVMVTMQKNFGKLF
jgi:hypothetical protein